MDSKPYSVLARLYEFIMRDIDYSDWAAYIIDIFHKHSSFDKRKPSLDIACGNARMWEYLKKYLTNSVLLDLSHQMLKQTKAETANKVCGNMLNLPFKGKFSYILSTFDSVNYLMTEEELELFFGEVKRVMADESIFTFDVSLEANSINNENELNRDGLFNGYTYKQKSIFDKESKIHYNYFEIIDAEDNKITETHQQKVYDIDVYFMALENAGLHVIECLDAFSFDDVDNKSERAQFVVRRMR